MADQVLLFNVGDESASLKVGKSYLLLGISASVEDARELASTLPANAGSKVVIVTREALLRRIPAVRLEDVEENAAE